MRRFPLIKDGKHGKVKVTPHLPFLDSCTFLYYFKLLLLITNNCFLPKERVVTKQDQNSVMTLTALFYTQIYCSYDQIYKEPHTVSRLARFHAGREIRNETLSLSSDFSFEGVDKSLRHFILYSCDCILMSLIVFVWNGAQTSL